MKKDNHTRSSVYCIFYIEREYYTTINSELEKKGYGNRVKAIIPTVRILRKVVHGRDVYEDVPLLFNYAFIRMPRKLAYSREFLSKLKKQIRGIRGWLKSTEYLHPKKINKRRIDNPDIWDDFSCVAMATKKEVRYFQKLSKQNKHFSVQDILNIKVGDYIVLKGYPYDGIDATVVEVNQTTKMVKLLLYPQMGKMEISLPFDQVIDTVYSNYDPELIIASDRELDMSAITEASINRLLELKQY